MEITNIFLANCACVACRNKFCKSVVFFLQAGNHDNSRLVSRYGQERAQALTMITLLLPGVGVTYNGEEIGMEDTWISWEDTKDPQGCNAGKENYEKASRDPCRTPFQWDDTTSAGEVIYITTKITIDSNDQAKQTQFKTDYFL